MTQAAVVNATTDVTGFGFSGYSECSCQDEFMKVTQENGLKLEPIGQMLEASSLDGVLITLK